MMRIIAKAHPVQGLLCAHGYKDPDLKTLPIRSIFSSLDALHTTVDFTFETSGAGIPEISINNRPFSADGYRQMTGFVERVFKMFNITGYYTITISQNFHLAIGIGSSASIYAALTLCIVKAAGKELSLNELSALARLGSYSAASAIVGNVSIILTSPEHEGNFAEVLCEKDSFPYTVLTLPVEGEKRSSEIHQDIPLSPFYSEWVKIAGLTANKICDHFLNKTFDEIGPLAERYIYANFAAISTGPRNILSWNDGTLKRVSLLRDLRRELKLSFFISVNSGPAVFVYLKPEEQPALENALKKMEIPYIASRIGAGAEIINTSPTGRE